MILSILWVVICIIFFVFSIWLINKLRIITFSHIIRAISRKYIILFYCLYHMKIGFSCVEMRRTLLVLLIIQLIIFLNPIYVSIKHFIRNSDHFFLPVSRTLRIMIVHWSVVKSSSTAARRWRVSVWLAIFFQNHKVQFFILLLDFNLIVSIEIESIH